MKPGQLFHSYMRGWHAGAGCKQITQEATPEQRAEYDRGWRDGRTAAREAGKGAGERLGYKQAEIAVMQGQGSGQ